MKSSFEVKTRYGTSPVVLDYTHEESNNRHLVQLSDGARSPQTLENDEVRKEAVKEVVNQLEKQGLTADMCEWSYRDKEDHVRGMDVRPVEETSHTAGLDPRPPGNPGTPSLDGEAFSGEARLYEMKAMERAEVKELFRQETERPAADDPGKSPEPVARPPVAPDL